MAEPERIVDLLRVVSGIATDKIRTIKQVTAATRILALNALVESNRAGEAGRGFAVVANEVKSISGRISNITHELESELSTNIEELSRLGEAMVMHVRGARLADLSLNMIEIIDRNLYERSCDVRWWATDSAVVDCLHDQSNASTTRFACKRLGVILDSYTVYLDLWVADANGTVVANGRPDRYPRAIGTDVRGSQWFRDAMATRDGTEFAVADISVNDTLDDAHVATYSTAIREGGEVNGRVVGALGIFFDWGPQSQAVVNGVRLTEDERKRTRAMLVDSKGRIIAASDRRGLLREAIRLDISGTMGNYMDENGCIVGYALTPGYETYQGLGWYGVIIQEPVT